MPEPGAFSIGPWKWGKQFGNALIKYKSAAANDQVKADGKDDARQTFKGRKIAEITITITWRDDHDASGGPGPIATYVAVFLEAISPRGLSAGEAWVWVERRQGIHNVSNVNVDEIETIDSPGTGSGVANIKLSSWVKSSVKPAVTATPAAAQPWSPGPHTATFVRKPSGFSATPVKVSP